MRLGHKIIENSNEELIKKIFMDVDFHDRTMLKVITDKKFAGLFASEKVHVLLDEIWEGEETYDCDGRITDFSLLTFLASAPIKRLPGKQIKVSELLSNNFTANVSTEKFWYQYKFRKVSISYIFYKEFICSLFLVGVFQYINFKYLGLFAASNFKYLTGDVRKAAV